MYLFESHMFVWGRDSSVIILFCNKLTQLFSTHSSVESLIIVGEPNNTSTKNM